MTQTTITDYPAPQEIQPAMLTLQLWGGYSGAHSTPDHDDCPQLAAWCKLCGSVDDGSIELAEAIELHVGPDDDGIPYLRMSTHTLGQLTLSGELDELDFVVFTEGRGV